MTAAILDESVVPRPIGAGFHPVHSTLLPEGCFGPTHMDDIGMLWIPAGFLVILGSVAVLFLTI